MPAKTKTTAKKRATRKKPVRRYYKRSVVYRGYGDYTTDSWRSKYAKKAGKYGGMIGAHFGGSLGQEIGNLAGQGLAHGIKYLTGFGDYSVKSNTLVYGQPPSVVNGAKPGGSIVISHKEYIGDVTSSEVERAFKVQKFPINPGDETTFPWLSQLAPNFQEYEFRGLLFHFRSMSSDVTISNNTAIGSVIMATQYDATQPDFISKAEMENYQFTNSVKPSDSCLHMVECARASNVLTNLYTRGDAVPPGKDPRFYDLGNFYVASQGCPGGNTNLGELWVTYEIELMKPKIYDSQGEDIKYFSFVNNMLNPSSGATGVALVQFGANNIWGNNVAGGGGAGANSWAVYAESTVGVLIDHAKNSFHIEPSAIQNTYILEMNWFGDSNPGITGLTVPTIDLLHSSGITQGPPVLLGSNTALHYYLSNPNDLSIADNQLSGRYVFSTLGDGQPIEVRFNSDAVLPLNTIRMQMNLMQIPKIEYLEKAFVPIDYPI